MSDRVLQLMVGGKIPVAIDPVGEVELLALLGCGGWGSVWKARDTAAGTLYALKVIQGLLPGSVAVERVRLEASVAIPSEHVVRPQGLREWDQHTFLILFEYFEGRSLDGLIAEGGLTAERKRAILRQILVGTADAHRANVTHRDIKPQNILVGTGDVVKMIDFGIAKMKGKSLTVSGAYIGTPAYSAPELIGIGSKVADARSDIYAIGQVWYELAMGRNFWSRKGWVEFEDFIVNFLKRQRPDGRYEGLSCLELDDFGDDFFPSAQSTLARMVMCLAEERQTSVDDVLTELGYIPYTPPSPITLSHPMLIVESGSTYRSRTVLGIDDGASRELGRFDFAGSDTSIGRRHLQVSRRGNRYFVRDLGSKNGTMMRGLMLSPTDPPTELRHGDRVKVGDVFLRFAFLHES